MSILLKIREKSCILAINTTWLISNPWFKHCLIIKTKLWQTGFKYIDFFLPKHLSSSRRKHFKHFQIFHFTLNEHHLLFISACYEYFYDVAVKQFFMTFVILNNVYAINYKKHLRHTPKLQDRPNSFKMKSQTSYHTHRHLVRQIQRYCF